MKHTLLLLSLLALATPGLAADAHDGPYQGDAEKGQAKAAPCAACHGADGNSSNPQWPKIAGQHASYIAGQLAAYKNNERQNPLMLGQVSGLSEHDMADLAAFFAAKSQQPGVADPNSVASAESIWRAGNAEAGIPACAACHGPRGLGNAAAAYPRVSGQHAEYAAMQLRAYRDGSRNGTANAQMMSQVAKGLSDADIDALASFMSGLH